MKFCLHCGEEIDDNTSICPKCGKSILSKTTMVNENSQSTKYLNKESGLNNVLTVFTIIASLVVSVGIILLAIGGFMEYQFRNEYDLSNLSDAGINLIRQYSNYANSIKLLTAGGICTGVGIILDIVIIPYRIMQNKNKGV